jgi:hypothetical protein
MKASSTLLFFLSSSAAIVSAFGVTHPTSTATTTASSSSQAAFASPLFRDASLQKAASIRLHRSSPALIRGGAVPGWAAYNDALDKKPLLTKALTSLVGWALGDLLAQVRALRSAVCGLRSGLLLGVAVAAFCVVRAGALRCSEIVGSPPPRPPAFLRFASNGCNAIELPP